MKHIICFSGGESSALCAIYAVENYGKENVILLNHDIKTGIEDADIKRFKNDVSNYLGLPITYANYKGIVNPDNLPDQFDVCLEAGALTNDNGDALCTNRLKTEPFMQWLKLNYLPYATLFEEKKDCLLYYGFDTGEIVRVQRRSGIFGAMGYKTDFPVFKGKTISSIREIGIEPPNTYSRFKHANCIGCLKAGLLHWYCVYCLRPDVYWKGANMERELEYTINVITRDKVKVYIYLDELAVVYESLKREGIEPTEHQSDIKFGHLLRKHQIEACNINKPCQCSE